MNERYEVEPCCIPGRFRLLDNESPDPWGYVVSEDMDPHACVAICWGMNVVDVSPAVIVV